MPKISWEIALAIIGLILTVFLIVLDKADKLKGPILIWLLILCGLMTLPLVLANPFVMDLSENWKLWMRAASIAVVVLFYWAIAIWISPATKTSVPAAGKPLPPPRITLEQLFKSDFPYAMKASNTVEIGLTSGFKTQIPYQVYFDFQGKSEFVGFFIAHSPKTFDICVGLPNIIPQVREEVRKRVEIQTAFSGQQTSLSDLTFTGRVFVYHEDFLTLEQIVELRKIFAGSSMFVEFRSTDYLAAHILPNNLPTSH